MKFDSSTFRVIMSTYWISTRSFTATVDVKDGKIVGAAPILYWAKGKDWDMIERQLKAKYFGVIIHELKTEGEIA